MKTFLAHHAFSATVLALALAVWSIHVAMTTHFSLQPLCAIDLHMNVPGTDRATLRTALAYLRAFDPGAYATTCAYIDEIAEARCIARDPRIEPSAADAVPPACYVRGTRTMYLAPPALVPLTTPQRAALIGMHAEYSRQFWENELYAHY